MTTWWTCQACGRRHEGTDGLALTQVPAVRLGACATCGKRTTWRPNAAVNAGAKVGERLAQRGMIGAESAEIAGGWTERADATLRELARSGERFTSDVLVAAVGSPLHFNAIGARINAAARAGVIRKAGYTKSSRESGHARTIAVWEGA